MKFALVLLMLLPVVLSKPAEKRLVLGSVFEGAELNSLVQQLVNTIGTDASEQTCENKCHDLIKQDHLLQFGCPLVCKSFQALVHRLGVHYSGAPPEVTTTA